MSMTIILDFDYTLFDTARFKEALIGSLTACGPSRERWLATYQEVVGRRGDAYEYDPDMQLELLASEMSCSPTEARQALDRVSDAAAAYLYPGALDFLVQLRADGHRLVMLTLGNPRWQGLKLEKSGVAGLMDCIVVVPDDKAKALTDAVAPDEVAIVINDNPIEVELMRKVAPQHRYLLARGPKGDTADEDVITCVGFSEMLSRISELA